MAESDQLFFPSQVHAELERYTNPNADPPDLPFAWADRHRERCTRHATDFAKVTEVLSRVPQVLDPEKDGTEEADPYVLALALKLMEDGRQPIVLTEEHNDRPHKMSLTTACGILRIHRLPLEAFLREMNIWTRPKQ